MIKIVCPRCLGENYTSSPDTKSKCAYCEECFSIDDILRKLKREYKTGYLRRIDGWVSNCP